MVERVSTPPGWQTRCHPEQDVIRNASSVNAVLVISSRHPPGWQGAAETAGENGRRLLPSRFKPARSRLQGRVGGGFGGFSGLFCFGTGQVSGAGIHRARPPPPLLTTHYSLLTIRYSLFATHSKKVPTPSFIFSSYIGLYSLFRSGHTGCPAIPVRRSRSFLFRCRSRGRRNGAENGFPPGASPGGDGGASVRRRQIRYGTACFQSSRPVRTRSVNPVARRRAHAKCPADHTRDAEKPELH